MLIGSDILPQILLSGLKQNVGDSLIAQNSAFGRYLSGPVHSEATQSFSTFIGSVEEHESLDQLLKKFWEQEVPPEHTPSPDDKYCEEVYSQTTYRNEGGRYVVRLPFKQEFSKSLSLGMPIHSIFPISPHGKSIG